MPKAPKPNILEALNAATAADLATIDEKIVELEGGLEGLKAARKVIDVRLNGRKPRGSSVAGDGEGVSDDDLRSRIHDWLQQHGEPAKAAQIGVAVGVAATKVGRLCNHEWFFKSPEGFTVA